MFVFLLMSSTGIHAQTGKPVLDQFKLMQQGIGTWEATVGKDTVEIRETQQYGKSFTVSVYYNINGKKSPVYISNYCIDPKDGKFKGFTLFFEGDYRTWIGLWTSEKKLAFDVFQNFKSETVLRKVEILYETPTKMTWSNFSTNGNKTAEYKYSKVK
jgi:hypothetical protein